ncbi:trans-aconitate 2-methyltransferase [Actinoplanes sp. N902-109]|uniref:trans-aconitate 2-methyltransferase n=1 Tax=Actinoplanes sp. (strain N902-109) TaxID=649831 RepID=UPI000329488B|nr:trans-aconitate 2-methyltransferase [Actinoplanes sp. N902-109]AGL19598.1 trans-aconitate 2-methyltransferase [Actinoplanes sp. N902-109]
MWDPKVYQRFGTERARPFFDLMGRVGAGSPGTVVDLGCGPGELTATLAERWPQARVVGIDSSPEMIGKAGALGVPVEFRVGDLAGWEPTADTGVVVTNAALQWVPGHQELLRQWAGALPDGAWFAMQVPGNFGAPSHRALREIGRSEPYAGMLGEVLREAPVSEPAEYAALFLAAGAEVDAWETTYLHLLPDTGAEHPVLRWLEGTALRPVKARLDDTLWASFRAALGARLAADYPARSGHVAFPFRRIFVVARGRQ